jgi:hypothetical protein
MGLSDATADTNDIPPLIEHGPAFWSLVGAYAGQRMPLDNRSHLGPVYSRRCLERGAKINRWLGYTTAMCVSCLL